MVLAVVPAKELLTERARILNASETFRKLGPVFEGLELTLRVRIIIRDMGSAVRLGDSQIRQSIATGLEVIEVPRSACRVELPGTMRCLSQVSAIKRLASSALSRRRPSSPRRSG